MGHITETHYQPAYIETVRIVNVNIQDWTVDCISEYANKRFFDIQVSSPYFHFMNGEGVYCMPEIGAMAWVCKPSSGGFAPPFILGFQSPFDEVAGNFKSGRPNLNPGDIMMRTRDENFLILRRGGVVQIGSTPTAQRMYLPIQNYIRDFCENYQLTTFGGELEWTTDRTDKTITGDALTVFALKAKSKSNDPEHVATLKIGSPDPTKPTVLDLSIFDSGMKGAVRKISLTLGKDGNVQWDVQGSWTQTVVGKYSVHSTDTTSLSSDKDMTLSTKNNLNISAEMAAKIVAKGLLELMSDQGIVLGGAGTIKLGGPGASQPVVKGTELATFLAKLCSQIAASNPPLSTGAAIGLMSAEIPKLLSIKTFTV